jgi:predicted RND superfamily exporter protein
MGLWREAQDAAENKIVTLAGTSARHPVVAGVLFLALAFSCASGLASMVITTETDELWVDQNSIPKQNEAIFKEHFPPNNRITQLIVTGKHASTTARPNILTTERFEEMFSFLDDLMALRTASGKNFTDLCARTPTGDCTTGGPQHFLPVDERPAALQNDTTLREAVSPRTWRTGGEVDREAIFGKPVGEDVLTSAEGMKLTFVLAHADNVTEHMEWEDKLVELAKKHASSCCEGEACANSPRCIHVDVFAVEKSIDDAMEESIGGDIPMTIMQFFIMTIFTAVTLGKVGSIVHMRMLQANAAVLLVYLSTAAAYGLTAYMGVEGNALILTLPFILVGIGLDDGFVITHAFDRTDARLPIIERIELAYKECGMSITLTSVTDVVAFALGSYTRLPAVQNFCLYACVSVLFIYFAHLTAYAILLRADAERQAANRADLLPCITCPARKAKAAGEESFTARRMEAVASWILHPPVSLAIVLVFTVVTAGMAYSLTNIDPGFDLRNLVPDQHYASEFLTTDLELFGGIMSGKGGQPTNVVVGGDGLSFSDVVVQRQLSEIHNDVLDLDSIDASRGKTDWHADFTAWARLNGKAKANGDGEYVTGDDFVPTVRTWLDEKYTVAPGMTIQPNKFHENHIVFNSDRTEILFSSVVVTHTVLETTPEQIDALLETQDWAVNWTKDTNGTLVKPFVFSPGSYQFYDQYRIIMPELLTNFGMCFVAVVAIASVMLTEWRHVLVLCAVLGVIYIDVLGALPVWGLQLNSISTVNLVMAVGLVVDPIAHVCHAFGRQDPTLSGTDRARGALRDVGPPVLLGCTSTFLGVLPIAFATSAVFRAFFQVMAVVSIASCVHGLILLPIVLAWTAGGATVGRTTRKMDAAERGTTWVDVKPRVSNGSAVWPDDDLTLARRSTYKKLASGERK